MTLPMNDNDPSTESWQRLARSVRAERAQAPGADESAPFGFATRVAALAAEKRREQLVAAWGRWSLRGAFCSLFVAGAAIFWLHSPPPAEAMFEVPDLKIPVPAAVAE